MEAWRYPVGRFRVPEVVTPAERATLIQEVEEVPRLLRRAVAGLSEEQLDTPYRPGGWTSRQVAHHLPDSHANAYVRFRLALTEHHPVAKAYQVARWGDLPDARTGPLDLSLPLLEALHRRWTTLMKAMTGEQWACAYVDPEFDVLPLDKALAKYAWHGRHHVSQITSMRERSGWR